MVQSTWVCTKHSAILKCLVVFKMFFDTLAIRKTVCCVLIINFVYT